MVQATSASEARPSNCIVNLSRAHCTTTCNVEKKEGDAPCQSRSGAVPIGWLAGQPVAFRDALLEAGDVRVMSPGSSIYGLGDPPGGLYGLVEGLVDVLIAPGAWTPMLVHVATPGWWVGEAAHHADPASR